MSFARFMAGPVGRGVRVVAGVAIIALGLGLGGPGGYVVAALGFVPLLAGAFNVCVIAPILRAPFRGSEAR
jgi:hypothetical protein